MSGARAAAVIRQPPKHPPQCLEDAFHDMGMEGDTVDTESDPDHELDPTDLLWDRFSRGNGCFYGQRTEAQRLYMLLLQGLWPYLAQMFQALGPFKEERLQGQAQTQTIYEA